METFKNQESARIIRNHVKNDYARCPTAAESRVLHSRRFGETHMLVAGSGNKQLILLHGSSGNSTAWFGMLEELCREYTVFMVDIPGQPGLSSSHRPGLNNGEITEWLDEVLASFGTESVHIAGMSLGGWLALDAVIRHPSRFAGAGLISPSGLCPPRAGFFFRILPLVFMGKFGQRRIFKLIHGPVPIHPEILSFGMQVSRGFKPMTETPRIFDDEELTGELPPLVFIGGEKDMMLNMPGSAKRLGGLVPEARILIRKDYGHVIPDAGRELVEFFQGSLL